MLYVNAESRKTFASRLVTTLMATMMATAPFTAKASPEGDMIASLVNGHKYMRLSGAIIEGDNIKKLYDAVGDRPLWVTGGQLNSQGLQLREIFLHADRHGLDAQDYWTSTIEALSKSLSANAWLSFEMALSNSLLRYAHDINAGRAEPNLIDDDIRFTRKPLDMAAVIATVQSGNLAQGLDNMAPKSLAYTRLMGALAKLQSAKAAGELNPLTPASRDLLPGAADSSLVGVKKRLKLFGYNITETESGAYTQELADAVKQFQDDSNLEVDKQGKILAKGAFWTRMAVTADDRIRSVQLSMEKLRWLPQTLEQRHVFVNLALSQFRLYENNQLVMGFRTVNGQPIRRTQSMRDYIEQVELNPDWGVPVRNAIKDKLPFLKQAGFMQKNNLVMYDTSSNRTVDPTSMFLGVDADDFRQNKYAIVQKPGYNSALGIMKFVMATNNDAIYLHDTNERELFDESYRLKSSGCVRLQRPLDFASYLFKNNPQWPEDRWRSTLYTANEPQGGGTKPERVFAKLNDKIYVYLMYLTAEVDEVGHIRFADDQYKQDERLAKAIWPNKTNWSGAGQNLGIGYMTVAGQAGPTQLNRKVYAYRCNPARRGACDAPVQFELNAQTQLPAGQYIVGFENSLNPGWVEVQQGRLTTINLQAVQLPSAVQRSKATIKVYRALDNDFEQTKFLWAFNQLGGHQPFPLAVYSFGDLYMSAVGEHDQMTRMNYEVCVTAKGGGTVEIQEYCARYGSARQASDLAPNFRFLARGFGDMNPAYVKPGFLEMELPVNAASTRGDVTKIQFGRHLVAAPMSGTDTVLLFPGVYSAAGTGVGPVSFQVGTLSTNY